MLGCWLMLWLVASSQPTSRPDYHRADSIALSIKKRWAKDPEILAHRLTDSLLTEQEKARAIYRWITAHIAYDPKAYFDRKKRVFEAEKILKRKRVVCSGYAILFQTLCEYAGLESAYVRGYARNEPLKIGRYQRRALHAWNAVKIDGKWQFVDTTWGSGWTDLKRRKFTRRLKDDYFLPNQTGFFLSHFPEDSLWLLEAGMTDKMVFFRSPVPGPAARTTTLRQIVPSEGILRQAPGENIRFYFCFDQLPLNPYMKILAEPLRKRKNAEPYLVRAVPKAEGEGYVFDFPVPKRGNYLLRIFLGEELFFTYRLYAR